MQDEPGAGSVDDRELVDDLISRAVDAYRELAEGGDLDPIWPLLTQAAIRYDMALEGARVRSGSTDPAERAVAGLLLGAVNNGREDGPWRPASLEICAAMLRDETDPDVVWAIAHALGSMEDARSASLLLSLAGHADSDVRFKVAMGLPGTYDQDNPDDAIVAALIVLSADEDEDVRDYATFGLGTTLESVDTPELRAALWARAADEHDDTRNEALAGLAFRHDADVVPLLAKEFEADDVDTVAVQAASVIADPQLLPGLRRLSESVGSAEQADLERAIERCEPALAGERSAAEQRLLSRLLQEAEDNPLFGTRVTGIALEQEFPRTELIAWVLSGPEPYQERWSVWGELCGRVTEDGRLAELDIERAVELVQSWTGTA
jgi:hypothetical protein